MAERMVTMVAKVNLMVAGQHVPAGGHFAVTAAKAKDIGSAKATRVKAARAKVAKDGDDGKPPVVPVGDPVAPEDPGLDLNETDAGQE